MFLRARLLSRLSPFATAFALLATPRAIAQTTITFTNGQTSSTAYDTSAPNSPTTLSISTGSATLTGALSGLGSLTKTGTGTVTLSGARTYSGGTSVTGGTLQLLNAFSANSAVSVSGAGSQLIAGTPAALAVLDIGSTGPGSLDLTNGGVATGSWYTRFGVQATGVGTATVSGAGSQLIANGDLELGTFGQGTLSVSGGGKVTANAALIFGSLGGTGTLNLNSGGTLQVGGPGGIRNTGTASFNLAGGTLRVIGSTLTTSVPAALSNASTVDTNGFAATLSGVLSGPGSLTKIGTGTLTLAGTNTFSGGTLVTGGTVNFSSLANFGNGNVTLNGGGLQWAAGTSTDISSRLNALDTGGGTFDTNGNNPTLASVISGPGALTKIGAGTLTLTGTNTYSGGTTVTSGTVNFSSLANFGTGAVTLNGGSLQWASGNTLDVTGSAQFNRTLSAGGGLFDTNGNNVTFASALSGPGSLTKNGAGSLTLTAANTYAGNTVVNAGALVVTGPGASLATDRVLVQGAGSFTLAGGATYASGSSTAFGGGTVTIDGVGSVFTAGSSLQTSTEAHTTLNVTNGGRLNTPSATFGVATGTMGFSNAPTGTVNVTGAGSLLQIAGPLNLGYAGTGTLNIGSGGTVTAANIVFGAVFQAASFPGGKPEPGSGILNLNPAGTLEVGGAFTRGFGYYGNVFGTVTLYGAPVINFSGGTIRVVDSPFNPSFPATLTNTTTIDTNGLGASIGSLSGTGGLLKTGTGVLTLGAGNTYTGGTTVAGGLVNFSSLANFGSGPIALDGGGLQWASGNTLDLTGSSQFNRTLGAGGGTFDTNGNNVAFSSALSGPGSLTKLGTGTLTLNAANTYIGATTVSAGTLALGTANTLSGTAVLTVASGATLNLAGSSQTVGSLAGAGSVALGTATLTAGGDNSSTAFSGVLSGPGNLEKTGGGTLTLSGANTYSGNTTVTGGTLSAPADFARNALVAVSGPTSVLTAGGKLQIGQNGTGSLTLTGGGTANSSGATYIGNGIGGLASAGTVSVTGTGSTLTTGTTLNLGYFGTGTLTIGSGGTVSAASLYSGYAGTGTLNLNSGGTLTLGGTDGLLNYGTTTFNFAGGTLKVAGSSLTSSVPATLTNTSTMDTNGLAATLSGALSGTGSLTKTGTGTLTLTGANTYTGGTTISGGTLSAPADFSSNAPVAVSGPASLLTAGGNLQIGQNGTGSLTLTGGGTASSAAATYIGNGIGGLASAGTVSVTGPGSALNVGTTLNLGYFGGGTLTIGSGGSVNSGNLIFDAAPGYSGTLNLNTGGTLRVGGTNGLRNDGTATFNLAGGTLQLNGSAFTTSVPATLSNSSTINTNALAATFSGVLSGPGSLTKTGVGTLTLSAANTYSGTTTVSAGTLHLTGSAAASAFTVNSGATLSGTGTIGALTLAGTVSPGASPGTISAGNTTFASGGSYTWEINNAIGVSGINYDLLSITGSLSITATSGSPFAINLTSLLGNNTAGPVINFNSTQNYSYTIATTTSGITGFSPSAFTLNTAGFTNALNGGTWSLAQSGNNLNLHFTASAIPEPSTYAAIFGAAALALAAYRRKNRSRSS
jgi:autotransporter-associated beta strand protein/T5SS/PEP-CTERM-associated repeat protein